MKRALQLIFLLGVFTVIRGTHDLTPVLILAGPKLIVPYPPDAPPPGPQMPDEPVQMRPMQSNMPPDFQEDPKDSRPQRKTVDPVRAQKDAEELAGLAKKVQDEVGQLSKNLLPKDLDRDLKHMQKLTKRLRGEIAP